MRLYSYRPIKYRGRPAQPLTIDLENRELVALVPIRIIPGMYCVCVCVFMEATDASRLVCVVVVSYQEYSLTHWYVLTGQAAKKKEKTQAREG